MRFISRTFQTLLEKTVHDIQWHSKTRENPGRQLQVIQTTSENTAEDN